MSINKDEDDRLIFVPGCLIVTFKPGVSFSRKIEILASIAGLTVVDDCGDHKHLGHKMTVTFSVDSSSFCCETEKTRETLAELKEVSRIELRYIEHTM